MSVLFFIFVGYRYVPRHHSLHGGVRGTDTSNSSIDKLDGDGPGSGIHRPRSASSEELKKHAARVQFLRHRRLPGRGTRTQ